MPKRTADPEPPTEPNKSPVRFNALKHGIYSVSPVIPHVEREEDWIDFRDGIFDSLQPKGGLEAAFADRIAALLWRIMRVVRYERESVVRSQARISEDWALAHTTAGEKLPQELTPEVIAEMDRMLMARLIPDDATLNKIMRYETRLHRHLLQTLHQLYSLRAAAAPPRVRADIEHTDVRRIAVRSPKLGLPAPHH